MKLFTNDLEARFVRRPNRFLIIAEKDGKELTCHCPNPGRLSELLFPGITLILEKRSGPGTGWTAVALKKETVVPGSESNIVPLYSLRANEAAEQLILPGIIPGILEIHREYRMGNSRFDFLCIDKKGKKHLVEVKACSLVEYGTAMFPDAPSTRALKHLEELAHNSSEGFFCHILFVIMHGKPEQFIPNIHTAPAFAEALCRYGTGVRGKPGSIKVHTALLCCGEDGTVSRVKKKIPPNLGPSIKKLAEADSGNYLVLL